MPHKGILRSWNEARGFGFIAPTGGGAELFVHISAFPRDGSRPVVGESLSYELGRGQDGKPQALRVQRLALGSPTDYPSPRRRASPPSARASRWPVLLGLGVLLLVGAYGVKRYAAEPSVPAAQTLLTEPTAPAAPAASFHCDGRTHCSQMRSCEEAKYFLKHCPGTQMDGNRDGVPCEQQWCTSAW